MIYEYAIEPAVAVSWGMDRAEYRYFFEKFGIGESRFMSEFPKIKKWRKFFKEQTSQASPMEEQRLTALFSRLTERMVRREHFEYDGTKDWSENVIEEDTRFPLQAILARENSQSNKKVLLENKLESHPLWQVKKQGFSTRKPEAMANLIAPLLLNSSEIYFIDPHFGPENARYRRPLKAFFEILGKRKNRGFPNVLEYHTSAKSTETFFQKTCREELVPFIPTGLKLTLKRWKEHPGSEKLHERYILTDLGGVKVGPGLDDGNESESFEVMLLEKNLYEKQWTDYIGAPSFVLSEDPVELIVN